MQQYLVSLNENGNVYFENNTQDFIEVVITVNGKCIKTGEDYDVKLRGYCFTSGLKKEIKKSLVKIRKNDLIKAYIYLGEGEYREEDIDIPPSLRGELVTKIKFIRHIQNKPMEVLEFRA